MVPRRRPLLAMAAIVSVVLGACTSNTATTAPSVAPASVAPASVAPASVAPTGGAGGTLTMGLYQQFTSFDPWSETGSGGDSLVMQLNWDMLAEYDEKGVPQMRLADSITASADAKTWTIKLKPNLKWSDGSPLTADDVIFSWKLGANPVQSYNSGLWLNVVGMADWQKGPDYSKDFTGITSPDPQTIVFQLIDPNAAFEATLLNFRNFILPKAALLAASPNIYGLAKKDMWALPFWQAPSVGEGPYLWSQTQTGQFLSFKPNPNWRGGPLSFSQVIMKPIASQSVAAAQLQAGDVDLAVVTLNDLPGLQSANFQAGTALAPFPIQADFNNSKASRFSDVNVRQAFMYGCDRAGFAKTFLQGKGAATATYFFPDWVDKTGINQYDFDLQKAKSLLDAAKFDYSKPVEWLSWNKDAADRQAFIEDCQSKMKSIGVTIDIVNGLDVTNKLDQAGQWDVELYGGYPIADPDQIVQFTSCSAIGKVPGTNDAKFPNAKAHLYGGADATNYCNPAFDTLMLSAEKTADQTQRAAIYKQAQDIWIHDVPIMIAYRNATAYAWSSKLSGIALYGDPSALTLKIDEWTKTP